MNRKEILDKATDFVMGKREMDYGSPEDNFQMIANLWSVYLRGDPLNSVVHISPVDVAMMMALLKVARIRTSAGIPSDDSFVDLAGYAACAGEIVENTGRHI